MLLAAVGVLGTTSIIFASTAVKTPAEVLSGLTGTAVETLQEEREAGKTYGSIAAENGKLDEFRDEMLGQKKVRLDQGVEDGYVTREEADDIYNTMKDMQEYCHGTGSRQLDKDGGYGFGRGHHGRGMGFRGNGMGRR